MRMSIVNLNECFWQITVGITAFRWKIAVVNLNSHENFYDNGASAVLRRVVAVSVDLPVILQK